VRLKHEDAGEAAHPVDVGEAFHGFCVGCSEMLAPGLLLLRHGLG
jgi:hypothetical protein